MYNHALVLGKFLPPTLGHAHLIDSAAAISTRVTVLACGTSYEPISPLLRYEWLKRHYANTNVTVVPLHEDLPQSPDEHPDFWPLWIDRIQSLAPNIDVVCTSEDYGHELARRLGAPHVLVDRERRTVPISGTLVRSAPQKYWDYIIPEARAHFLARIAILGPESTGKSTLTRELSEHYQTVFVPEYGREYVEQHAPDYVYTLRHMAEIAQGQCDLEARLAPTATRFLFCDTDALTTKTWSEMYFDTYPKELDSLIEAHHYDLTLVLDIDLPWIQDGTRQDAHRRTWHFEHIKKTLDCHNRPYTLVTGQGSERLARAIELINQRFLL